MADPILVARGDKDVLLLPRWTNRHGLIAGATGTGKTVTLQAIAEGLSRIGVPVFLADVKGDLAGLSQPGGANAKVDERVASLGLKDFAFVGRPVVFWDVFGEQGHPVRATPAEMGPLLLGRLLDLNDVQSGVLAAVFKISADENMPLLDLADLRRVLQYVAQNASKYTMSYGNIATASVGAIQRGLLRLEQQGGDKFLKEPALDLMDFIRVNASGQGVINVLSADKLLAAPVLYATFVLWLLTELFRKLPEVGDPEKPKLVFFFDEAHLLFADAPQVLLEQIEQVVRLIRSKGVGVYMVTQNPMDVPDIVLGQLGNRVQHALRAYTPRDQKAVKAAASTFRPNPKLSVEEVITELGVGEALCSMLDDKGAPTVVERAFVVPPRSRLGPITDAERQAIIKSSPLFGRYEQAVDRESAKEILDNRGETLPAGKAAATKPGPVQKFIQNIIKGVILAFTAKITRQIVNAVVKGVSGSKGRR